MNEKKQPQKEVTSEEKVKYVQKKIIRHLETNITLIDPRRQTTDVASSEQGQSQNL